MGQIELAKKERVIAYIDGYNFYMGLKEAGFQNFKWIDLQTLVENLIKKGSQTLIKVKYFTTLATDNADKRLRQKEYIRALETKKLVEIIYGKFQNEKSHCKKCGQDFYDKCEKMTDVNLASNVIIDYYEDRFDMAMIISGDTDLIPVIKFVNERPDNKRVFVSFPPYRSNDDVKNVAKGSMPIGRANIAQSLFADTLKDKYGEIITKPATWM